MLLQSSAVVNQRIKIRIGLAVAGLLFVTLFVFLYSIGGFSNSKLQAAEENNGSTSKGNECNIPGGCGPYVPNAPYPGIPR